MTKYTLIVSLAISCSMLRFASGAFPNPPSSLSDVAKSQDLELGTAFGGPEGETEYGKFLPSGVHFTKILVAHWSAIDGVDLTCSDGSHIIFGTFLGTGEHPEELHQDNIEIPEGVTISAIDVSKGNVKGHLVLNGITFHLSNKMSISYGENTSVTLAPHRADSEIVGFFGHYGSLVDSVGVISRKVAK